MLIGDALFLLKIGFSGFGLIADKIPTELDEVRCSVDSWIGWMHMEHEE
jgi:hypothetical protein